MEISKTKIEKRIRKKKNPSLVNALIKLKKTNPEVAKILAGPLRRKIELNLDEIDRNVKDGERILVPGKILGSGDLTKKIKIVAWNASAKAQERIADSKGEFSRILEEMKSNPELKNLRVVVN